MIRPDLICSPKKFKPFSHWPSRNSKKPWKTKNKTHQATVTLPRGWIRSARARGFPSFWVSSRWLFWASPYLCSQARPFWALLRSPPNLRSPVVGWWVFCCRKKESLWNNEPYEHGFISVGCLLVKHGLKFGGYIYVLIFFIFNIV